MKKFLLALAFCLLALTPLQAADSAANRAGSSFQVGYTPVSINFPNQVASPFTVAAHLGPEWTMALEKGQGDQSFKLQDLDIEGHLEQQGISARWFPGNNFNIYLGLHMRKWQTDVTLNHYMLKNGSYNWGAYARGSVSARATVGTLAVGNQWQFDWGGVIGVDWFNIAYALSKDSSYSVDWVNEESYRAEAEEDLEDVGGQLNGYSSSVGALNLYLAYSF